MTTLISIDLDDLECHHAVFGLNAPSMASATLALERWLPRALEWLDELGARATLFVIGRDLARDMEFGGRGYDALSSARAQGHELANHSFDHAYDMAQWTSEAIAADLGRCESLLRELGGRGRGFRAPGYTHHARLLMLVGAMGYAYDSSSLPAPAYYAAKLTNIAAMRLVGRRSASQVEGLQTFIGPTRPRYLSAPGLWEVPVSVSPLMRLPFTGATLLAGPNWLRRSLLGSAEQARYLHIQLHAIDFADTQADGLDYLRRYEPVLRVPLSLRKSRLSELLRARGGAARPIAAALPDAPEVVLAGDFSSPRQKSY